MGDDFLDQDINEEDAMFFFTEIHQTINKYFLEAMFIMLMGREYRSLSLSLYLVE